MPAPDVAIVGGGIIGAAAAAFLSEAGARVRLYEAASIAAGASGRNSGVVQHPLDPELAALHRETLGLYRDLVAGGSDSHAADEAAFAITDEPAGLLYVGRDGDAVRRQREVITAALPTLGAEIVEGAALRALEPSLAPGLVACRVPIGYPVGPAAATRAYARRARALGADVRTGTPVDLAVDADRVTGVRAGGILEPAGLVLVTAGPWSPGLIDPTGAWRPIRPSWGVVVGVGLQSPPRHVLEEAGIATEPGDAASARGHDSPEATSARDVEFSLVTSGGVSNVGSTFLSDEPEPTEWAPAIVRRGASYVPAIASAPVLGYRSCARPLAHDGRPLVGRVPWLRNAFMAAGHGPWGVSTGPASARQVVDAILGRPGVISTAFDPGRFGSP